MASAISAMAKDCQLSKPRLALSNRSSRAAAVKCELACMRQELESKGQLSQ